MSRNRKAMRPIQSRGGIRPFIIMMLFIMYTPTMARTAASKATVVDKQTVSMKHDRPKWLEVCNQIAPATSVLCSLAPLPTIFEVSRSKSVGDLPLLPYSSMAANGLIWALYGWLTDSPQVKWANVAGTLLGSYYWKEFKKYSKVGSSNLPGTMKQHLFAITWIVLANTFVLSNFSKKQAADIIGKEGVLV